MSLGEMFSLSKLRIFNSDYLRDKFFLDKTFYNYINPDMKEVIIKSYQDFSKYVNYSSNRQKKNYRTRNDCIRKRIKALCHRHIIKKLNLILSNAKSKRKFTKLNRELSIVVKKELNRTYMESSLQGILELNMTYQTDNKRKSFEAAYNDLVLIDQDKEILSTKIKSLYFEYFKSEDFISDIEKLQKKETQDYIDKYKHLAQTFVKYYTESK